MKRNHLSFFLAPRIPFAAADLVADARARTEINSHFGATAGRADARRRDEVDVGHRRGAATKQMPARRRAPGIARRSRLASGPGGLQQNANLFLREP